MTIRVNYNKFDRFREMADSAGLLSPDSALPSFSAWAAYYDSSGDSSILAYCHANTPTFDDSDSLPLFDMSSEIFTWDEDHNFYWDSDSAGYATQISERSV